MSDALSDDGSDINQYESQEDVMTPAELIAKLEEVSSFKPKYSISQHTESREPLIVARRHVMAPIRLSAVSSQLCVPVCHSQAWLNEKFSPELLENRSEVVECVMEQLTHMVNSAGNTSCSVGCMLREVSTYMSKCQQTETAHTLWYRSINGCFVLMNY